MTVARAVLFAAALTIVLAACGDGSSNTSAVASGANSLTGLFRIAPGQCAGTPSTGSWFRMVQPGGDATAGPFVSNGDSTCADNTVTPLSPGSDGGLRTGAYQPQPEPPFNASGGSSSAAVIQPQAFFAVVFGVSTNEHDPQTGTKVPPPAISRDGSSLSGDLSSFSVSWNGQQFNQGVPKPGAGSGSSLRGSYDEAVGSYSLEWTSPIEGGPFNGFTGIWHLEGTFQPQT